MVSPRIFPDMPPPIDPAWFLGRWQENQRDAWLNEANRLLVLAYCQAGSRESTDAERSSHWIVVQQAMADAFEYGKMVGAIEATTKKGTP